MRIVQINSFSNGSTGKIMRSISEAGIKENHIFYNFFGRGNIYNQETDFKIESIISIYFHALIARLGFNGRGSYIATKRLIKKIKKINPDIIQLHNIHGYYINLKVLFDYLKKDYEGKIIWTLHDCWSFTGHCPHFNYVKCQKWKSKCYACPQLSRYPSELFDTTSKEYLMKKKLFQNINNLTIVTPSNWLANLVKESFLKEYKIEVINNGIDINIFNEYKSKDSEKIKSKYNIPSDKKIILGVANVWEKSKGIDDFIELSKKIDESYVIVLVGVDNKLSKHLPKKIIKIEQTDNQEELAKIYNLSDIYLNLSTEESFGLTVVEAISCGTKSITYNQTALPEIVEDKKYIINYDDNRIQNIIYKIKELTTDTNKIHNSAIKEKYNFNNQNKKYIDLYLKK